MRPDFTPSPPRYPFESRGLAPSAGQSTMSTRGRDRRSSSSTPTRPGDSSTATWSSPFRVAFRCVAVDYPGFGFSDRPANYGYTPREHAQVVGELVDHVGLDGVIVMGHDWGGPIGLSMAAARADRVAGLVLGNTWFGRRRAERRCSAR